MEIGDKIGKHCRIHTVCGYLVRKDALCGRLIKDIIGDKFQLQGDHNFWFYIKDIDLEPNYEIY